MVEAYWVLNRMFAPRVSATGPLGVITMLVLLPICVRLLLPPVLFGARSAVFRAVRVTLRPVMSSAPAAGASRNAAARPAHPRTRACIEAMCAPLFGNGTAEWAHELTEIEEKRPTYPKQMLMGGRLGARGRGIPPAAERCEPARNSRVGSRRARHPGDQIQPGIHEHGEHALFELPDARQPV